jgi:DNA-binding Lrp family transcriptional regulator
MLKANTLEVIEEELERFEERLEKLMKMHGIKAVTTSVVLHTYKLNGR